VEQPTVSTSQKRELPPELAALDLMMKQQLGAKGASKSLEAWSQFLQVVVDEAAELGVK
jgi:hypothetical protein